MSSAAKKIGPVTFEQIEAALDARKLEMMRPWGDWVPVRRRGNTVRSGRANFILPVFMEHDVEASISSHGAINGFVDCRISP